MTVATTTSRVVIGEPRARRLDQMGVIFSHINVSLTVNALTVNAKIVLCLRMFKGMLAASLPIQPATNTPTHIRIRTEETAGERKGWVVVSPSPRGDHLTTPLLLLAPRTPKSSSTCI